MNELKTLIAGLICFKITGVYGGFNTPVIIWVFIRIWVLRENW